jgi:hypothetical protein
MGGKGGADTPDTVGAARAAGEEARKLNDEQTRANRPDQYNPWGSTEWTNEQIWQPDKNTEGTLKYNPQTGRMERGGGSFVDNWTQKETLNEDLQGALDNQFGQIRGRSELASGRMDDLQNEMGSAHDFDQYGDVIGFDPTEQRQTAEDNAYQKSANRLDSRYGSEAKEMEISLRNKGLRAGDQAYDSAMESFGRDKNDAYEQARLGATAEGRDEYGIAQGGNEYANELRRSQIEEDLYKRGHTLEEINKLMKGQEVSGGSPSMPNQKTIGTDL